MEARTRPAEAAIPLAREQSTLSVENLQKRYGNRAVVKDVSLTVQSGEVVGLLGPNGAGKTTCFYMVVGLVPLDDGDIRLDGHSISITCRSIGAPASDCRTCRRKRRCSAS